MWCSFRRQFGDTFFVLIYEAIPDAILDSSFVVCCKIIPYPRVLLFIIKYTGSGKVKQCGVQLPTFNSNTEIWYTNEEY